MTEQELSDAVHDYATLTGWIGHHTRPARTATGWRTALSGTAGFPDWVFARRGQLRLVELKATRGILSDYQKLWRGHLDPDVYRLWYPTHWEDGTIERDLA